MPYADDEIPEDWFEDPIRIWQAQITGEKDFDTCGFMGWLNDFPGMPHWRDAFKGVEDCTGMAEFMDRLQGYFDIRAKDDHPSPKEIDPEAMIALTRRHFDTLVKAYERSGDEAGAEALAQYPIVWTDQPLAYFSLPWRGQQNATDRPIKMHLQTAWEFEIADEDYFLGKHKKGTPNIVSKLEEATYALANDFGLQRYLMQSFVTHGLDVDAQYELEWVNRCMFYFYDDHCFVTPKP